MHDYYYDARIELEWASSMAELKLFGQTSNLLVQLADFNFKWKSCLAARVKDIRTYKQTEGERRKEKYGMSPF